MSLSLESFIAKWAASGAAERANKDSFLRDLCEVLDVPHPEPTTGDPDKDKYVFERDARLPREGGTTTVGKIDLYKHECFVLEAKQGSESGAKKLGTAKRETPGWNVAMKDAYGQAIGYARAFDKPVPFLVVADLGYCFDLYAAFDGSWDYRPYPNAQSYRLFVKDLSKHTDVLRKLFVAPHELDPSKHAAKVTREIAGHIANLARKLEADKHPPELVATFLMRCLFTMFAEDVGLLGEGTFTHALRDYWIKSPKSFPGGIESLWRAMNEGGDFFTGRLLKFNGGLFAQPSALPLDEHALRLLAVAAECDWSEVEPAIFGTLLERALDPKERHRLGAHYTPRAYVERLVRPTIEEPLRADWDLVQAQVRKLVGDAHGAKTDKDAKKKTKDAATLVREFHTKLTKTRVLDPACGTGNFLYVTLDLFKRLEGEVLATLEGLGEKQELLHMDSVRVTPSQFLGIEVKRWAKEIAELVLWIGYLQWHFRIYGKNLPVPEPVLRDYKNIECRDAVLAYDAEELVRDEKTAKPITRWDGETMKKSAVTGEDVPDESAQVPIYRYVNPRQASWPLADFVVGNPPFVANRNMRSFLGDGYVEALRATYPEVKEAADLVMFFWIRAAVGVASKGTQRAGLITTSSIRQPQNQGVVRRGLDAGCRLVFAVPDHPWPDDSDDAEVRVSMTVLAREATTQPRIVLTPTHDKVARGKHKVSEVAESDLRTLVVPEIPSDLSPQVDTSGVVELRASASLSSAGMKPYGKAFLISAARACELIPEGQDCERYAPEYRNGEDIGQVPRGVHVIDLFGLAESDVQSRFPRLYQYLLTTAKPERSQERNQRLRTEWWLFEASRPDLRDALRGLSRFIVTVENSPVRAFVFLEARFLPDQKLRVIASDEASILGVLSSRVHGVFAQRVGGRQGVRNTPVYNTRCFSHFPFPSMSEVLARRVAELGEALEKHRKRQQAEHDGLTLTSMYSVLEKLRSADALSKKELAVHEQGLVSVLKKIHDDLDAAVFDAYGWPHDLTDEQILERLVALNKERAEEEKRGLVRWLRPEFQNPSSKPALMKQIEMLSEPDGDEDEEVAGVALTGKATLPAWPKKLAEQIGTVRDLVTKSSSEWSAENVAANFKSAKADDVGEVLDSLAALGLLVTYELEEGRRWRASAFVSVRPPPM